MQWFSQNIPGLKFFNVEQDFQLPLVTRGAYTAVQLAAIRRISLHSIMLH